MRFNIKITIERRIVRLELCDDAGNRIAKKSWTQERNISDKLIFEIGGMLKRRKIALKNVDNIAFDCDSPYFSGGDLNGSLKIENLDSTGKCGFTAWQAGEMISKALNFAIKE